MRNIQHKKHFQGWGRGFKSRLPLQKTQGFRGVSSEPFYFSLHRIYASQRKSETHILALGLGMAAGLLIALSGLLTGVGVVNVILNLASSALALGLIAYANRTGHFARCYRITVGVVFILFFPVMFFAAGGYRSGMPSFFIFAVLFAVFMLEGRECFPAALLEMALYVGVCFIALRWPHTVYLFESEADAALDVIVGFVVSGMLLGVAMATTLGMYDDARRRLAEKNVALERIDRLRAEFLGDVAHELKTPLTVISGYAQEGEKYTADRPELDELGHSRQLIASEADRFALMVSQALDVTRIDEGRMRFDLRPASLVQIVQSTLGTYPTFSKNGNTLEVECGGCPQVLCDIALNNRPPIFRAPALVVNTVGLTEQSISNKIIKR